MNERVAVIGGGFAGLEVANALARKGQCEVMVFDTIPERPDVVDSLPPPKLDRGSRSMDGGLWADGSLPQYKRLGGRSLYYQGVMLPIETSALSTWPAVWQQRLLGKKGEYQTVYSTLQAGFPELQARRLPKRLEDLGLQHAPQAIRLENTGQAHIYTPLQETLGHYAAGRLWIKDARVQNLVREPKQKWAVQYRYGTRNTGMERGFDTCVLAASAIGNAQILARALDKELALPITDHIGIGALTAPQYSAEASLYRHSKLWTGYLAGSSANIFVQEMHHHTSQYALDVSAVLEQHPHDQSRQLIVSPHTSGPRVESHVTRIDIATAAHARQEMLDLIAAYTGHAAVPFSYQNVTYDQADALHGSLPQHNLLFYLFEFGTFQHEAQTTPIGLSTPDLTITEDMAAEQLPGIYIAGPGVFPRLGKANPALTIIASSRILAEVIAHA